MSSRILIHGGFVLTLGPKSRNFTEADVLIEDGRISEVAPNIRARDAQAVDASEAVIMPGFVDTHRHVSLSMFRNLGDAPSPGGGTSSVSAADFSADDTYAATLVGLLGAVEAGITTVVDWSDIPLDGGHTEAALQAHADAGLRTVLIPSPLNPEVEHEAFARLERLAAESRDPRRATTTVAFGTQTGDLSDVERVAAAWDRARKVGLRIHAHAGMSDADAGSIARLGQGGLLGDDVTLVHCSHLDGADLDEIASTGTAVALTPSSEMAAGLGTPPIQALIDRGIRPGLGIDDERIAPGDLFAQMRAAISLQHAAMFDLKLAGKASLPNLLTTREVIRYATVDGARVAGLGEVTGSLEPGKQADLVILRTDRPNVFPINDPIGAVVWGMDTSNVDWVFAAGRALMRNGVLEADVVRARDLANEARHRINAAGSMAETGKGAVG